MSQKYLTDDEIRNEHNEGDNHGWMEFARAIESMAIEAYKASLNSTDEELA